jgi:histidinol-phosphatase (PHP family)
VYAFGAAGKFDERQILTFGSDAHPAQPLAGMFPEAIAMVEAFGFRPGRHPEDFWTR